MSINGFVNEHENKGRLRLQMLNNQYKLFKEIHFTAGALDYIDADAISYRDTPIIIEIKTRRFPTFRYEEMYIDKTKFDKMLNAYKEDGLYPLLIYFFEDNGCMIFDLTKWRSYPPEETEQMINDPVHTHTLYETRKLYKLHYKDAWKIFLHNREKDKWEEYRV